jgi:hypothetical protein
MILTLKQLEEALVSARAAGLNDNSPVTVEGEQGPWISWAIVSVDATMIESQPTLTIVPTYGR